MLFEGLRQSERDTILARALHYGDSNVRVFGSVAHGQADDRSDLDLLVDLDNGRTLMDLGVLQYDLDAQLNIRVDVATVRTLRPDIRDRVLAEAVPL